MRESFQVYLADEENPEDFAIWAFGEGYREIKNGHSFIGRWNALHGHYMTLKSSGHIVEDMPKMVSYWRERSNAGLLA